MSDKLFRSRPSPIRRVFDTHINAVPSGTQPPDSFYSSVTLESVSAGAADPDADGFQLSGGCVSAPAGVDLLSASLALKTQCSEIDSASGNWRALLRFDNGSGQWPVTGPASRIAQARRQVSQRLNRTAAGKVSHAVLNDPELLTGFAGVKLMPQMTGLPDDKVLGLLGERSLPILVHAGSFCPISWIQSQLLPRTSSPVILAHLGSWPCSADDLDRAVQLAESDSRVFLETSGASIGNFIRHAASRVPEKLLFGSNTPMCPASVQWQHVSSSIEDDNLLQKIAEDTARELFALAPSPGTAGGATIEKPSPGAMT